MNCSIVGDVFDRTIAERVRREMDIDPELFEEVSVMFSDVADFNAMIFQLTPHQVACTV